MQLIVFGLSVSSAWGNGHATLWRGLIRALARLGHHVTFYERDVPYYAAHRDCLNPAGGTLRLYASWNDVRREAEAALRTADVAIVTSYCPDALAATELVTQTPRALKVFYDLDTPVTLSCLRRGQAVAYLPPNGLGAFDLVLSYTGGEALTALATELGARCVAPLYGSVDPEVHAPARTKVPAYAGDLSYLGTYAQDRQAAVEALFLAPARRAPARKFVLGGSQYPADFPWTQNLYYVRHVPPAEHAAFYASSRLTLNVTRGAMAAMGYCPSGRLFEAAACGAAIVSDFFPGLHSFYERDEILVARDTDDVLSALERDDAELKRMGSKARERTLSMHTTDQRARELEQLLESASWTLRAGAPCARPAPELDVPPRAALVQGRES